MTIKIKIMSKKIFDSIVEELLSGVDLDGMSEKDKDKLSKRIMDNLYYRIILKSIESVDENKQDDLINELQFVRDDVDAVIETLQKYISNVEDIIAQVMGEYKEELMKSDSL